jgi:hypothetical protein
MERRPEQRDDVSSPIEIVRGEPLDEPPTRYAPLPGTPPSEEIVSAGRDED